MSTFKICLLVAVLSGACLSAESSNSTDCVFPFTYDGLTYDECTTDGSVMGMEWCATTDNYEADEEWKYCSGNSTESITNSTGEEVLGGTNTTEAVISDCVFPFTYNGEVYQGCTLDDSTFGNPWCATIDNYDEDKAWKYCEESDPIQTTTEKPGVCVFPFTYKEEEYSACTSDGSVLGAWCATTDSYDKDGEWKRCDESDLLITTTEAATTTTTEKLDQCVLPFIYNDEMYYKCVDSWTGAWCATTDNYDKDEEWKRCSEEEKQMDASPGAATE